MPPDPQIDAGFAKPQLAQDHLIEERGQFRIAQPDLRPVGIEFEPERSLEQRKRRCARPGLWRAGDRIKSWSPVLLAAKAAEEFGQPSQIHVGRRVEQSLEDMLDRMLQAVAREPER